ncbi:MAG: SPOR domain-containing protein [Tateyamaria sp.]|uniref:SPOR domain-containing protein n=1 Tax=Tateyamaria sp. TaxID=1929288 RepID=UPI00326D270D
MKLTRIAAITVIGLGFGSGAAYAQNLAAVQAPAELPPASYRGAQYVDSNGCVFIRAGIDGNINWVPQVNQQRQLICGQTPTLIGTQSASASAPSTPVVVESATTTQASQGEASTARPQARPAPAAVASTPAPAAAAPRVARTTPKATTAPPVVTPRSRIVPRQVYETRPRQDAFPVPKGYRRVWDDDRLNPRRAEQSLEGVVRTQLVWTQTVPRRLVDRTSGKDVTATIALVYPYTDMETQLRELGSVTLVYRDGQLQKRIVRNKAKTRAPTVSTRSAPEPVVPAKAKADSTGRYVQVGTYDKPANAQAAAQRIIRAGLPARIGKTRRGLKRYQVVVAGPFESSNSLAQALNTSRAAGFKDAFVR